jgi:hypothetical protein
VRSRQSEEKCCVTLELLRDPDRSNDCNRRENACVTLIENSHDFKAISEISRVDISK